MSQPAIDYWIRQRDDARKALTAAESRVADLEAGIRSLIADISGSYTGIGDSAIRDALRALVGDEETR